MTEVLNVRNCNPRVPFSVAVTALVAIALGGCSAEVVPTPAPTPGFTSTWQAAAPSGIAPLTGRTVEPGAPANPSIAAKIDNHPAARPQVGLETTDLVFEELVEGGLTRYVAIWQSSIPTDLGPVRSIRPMDPDIISPFGGIVAYSGGQQRFVVLMQATPVYNAIHGQRDTADTFYRTNTKEAPHNVLVKAQQVVAQHAELAPPPQQFAFSLDVPSSTAAKEGEATARMNLRLGVASAPSWAWSEEARGWLRYQDGVADFDSKGGQLTASNVVILRVPVSYGLGVPKTELIGTGEAWIASGGATVHATWSKSGATAPIRLVDDQGVVVRLAPGNSWIELVPLSGSVAFIAPE